MSDVSFRSSVWNRRRPASAGLVSACLFIVCGSALLLDSPDLKTFDESIIRAARDAANPATPIGPRWLVVLARDVTALGGYAVLTLVSVLAWGFMRLERRRREATWFAATAAGGYLLNTLLKLLIARPRPDIVPHLSMVDSPSFPSGHAMMSAVVFLTLGLLLSESARRKSVRTLCVVVPVTVAAVVGLTRVYLGVHYPSDVFCGLCCGIAWTSGCWLVLRRPDGSGGLEASS